uniref:Uncharacterized protein n=1 Tax=Arundo donax TaxID=35708 RepID=A0A0A8ZIS0_ARUDO
MPPHTQGGGWDPATSRGASQGGTSSNPTAS